MAKSGWPRREAVVPAPVCQDAVSMAARTASSLSATETYHVHGMEANLKGRASRETVVDARAHNELVCFKYHLAQLGGSRGGKAVDKAENAADVVSILHGAPRDDSNLLKDDVGRSVKHCAGNVRCTAIAGKADFLQMQRMSWRARFDAICQVRD